MAGIPAGMESDGYSDEEDFILEDFSQAKHKPFQDISRDVVQSEAYPHDSIDSLRSEDGLKKREKDRTWQDPVPTKQQVDEEETKGYSLDKENPSMLSILSQKSDQCHQKGVTLDLENIRMAIIKGNLEYVKQALENGFDPNTELKSGWSPLMYASNSAFVDIVSLLIDSGANPNYKHDLFTPMMAVCTSSKAKEDDLIACADELVAAGCDINGHDRHLLTPLMYASQYGRSRLVEFLLARNADITKQDTRGWNALCYAAHNGHAHVARSLLERNVDPKVCAYDGQTPADLAYASGYLSLADILDGSVDEATEKLQKLSSTLPRRSTTAKKTSRFVQYGDLELFLSGMELSYLIPLFHDHQVSFPALLKMTNEDLMQIGIDQFGLRQKILDGIRSIHTNEWDLTSLSNSKLNKIGTIEASAIISNVNKHLIHIQSSVEYVKRYIEFAKEKIKQDDQTLQKSLCQQCSHASEAALKLATSLRKLEVNAVKSFPAASLRTPDVIETLPTTQRWWSQPAYLKSTAAACAIGVGLMASYVVLRGSNG